MTGTSLRRFLLVLISLSAGLGFPPGVDTHELRQIQPAVSGTFVDPRDGEVYGWVRIGEQVWMAENMRYAPETGARCWNDDEAECATRGRLYDWETAIRIALPGWHLPSEAEWQTLERTLGLTPEQIADTALERGGDANTAASRLKKPGSWPTQYDGKPIAITNDTGFSAVDTGFFANGEFTHSGHTAWWSSTGLDDEAWIRMVSFHDNKIRRTTNKKTYFFPVRLVKDDIDRVEETRANSTTRSHAIVRRR